MAEEAASKLKAIVRQLISIKNNILKLHFFDRVVFKMIDNIIAQLIALIEVIENI